VNVFVLVPRSSVYGLWDAFNDIAEGYALSIDEFYDVIKVATVQYISCDEKKLFGDVDRLFRAFDTDEVSYHPYHPHRYYSLIIYDYEPLESIG
jgi:hypothetical protein